MKKHYRIKAHFFLVLLLLTSPTKSSNGQSISPIVIDVVNNIGNGLIAGFQGALNLLLKSERSIMGVIDDIHGWIKKANTLVNSSVKNLRLIRQIINTNNDIIEMQSKFVAQLNEHADIDGNGIISLSEIDQKWKLIKVSLGLLKESTNYFQIVGNILEDNAFTMDDESRVQLLVESYKDLIQIKSAMRIHIRRTYKKNRAIQQWKREIKTYKALFNIN